MEAHRISEGVRIDCPGKVNLFLEVLAKRPDGFHELETFMTAISIYDSIFVSANTTRGKISLRCDWAGGLAGRYGQEVLSPLPTGEGNLVYRAAELLARESGITAGVSLRVVKRIPSEAGLGGASSDAAGTLLALNGWWGLNWERDRLAELGARLGSDIPFFLGLAQRGSLAAVCRGRGEKIEPVRGLPRLHLVVMKPPVGLSTPAVFRRCSVPAQPRSVKAIQEVLERGRFERLGTTLFNRLQEPAEQLSPAVVALRQACDTWDIWGHAMSGSGSSYFAVCRSAQHARQIAARQRARGDGQVFAVATL